MAAPPLPYFDFGGNVMKLKQYTIYEAYNPHRMLVREGNSDLLSDGWTVRYIFYTGSPYSYRDPLYVHETLEEPHRCILSLNAEPNQGWFIRTKLPLCGEYYTTALYIGEAGNPFRQMVDCDQDRLLHNGWSSTNLPIMNVFGFGRETELL